MIPGRARENTFRAPWLLALAGTLALACTTTRARALEGLARDPLADTGTAVVLLFVDTQCPISNAYAPEMRRLEADFAPRGVHLWLVYADPERTAEEVRAHVAAFDLPLETVLDAEHELARRAGATITPEACVFTASGELVYRGRIDDRYVDFGKQRAAASTHDLRDALEAVLDGKRPAEPWPPAVGCGIPGMEARFDFAGGTPN